MRPTEDLPARARNWFWYWTVKNHYQLSDDKLDRRFLATAGSRRRHFERIGQTASSPATVAIRDGKTLLELVDQDGLSDAKLIFDSELWEYLSTRDSSAEVYSDFIAQVMKERGWYRINADDRHLYSLFLGKDEPAVEAHVATSYSAMLHMLINDASIQSLAVLVALFREAMANTLLDQALSIRIALRGAVTWTCHCHNIPELPTRLLRQLIDDRVLSNRWLTEKDWWAQQATNSRKPTSTRERVRNFSAWVNWYTQDSYRFGTSSYGLHPIVPRSKRIDWIEEQRLALTRTYHQIKQQEGELGQFDGSLVAALRRLSERTHSATAELISAHIPPDSASESFYKSRPPLEIEGLPEPY